MATNIDSTPAASKGLQSSATKGRILILDDEASLRRLMKVILEGEGYEVWATDDGNEALASVEKGKWDVILQDLRMPKMDGMTFLRKLKEKHPHIICVVLTAFGTWETAVEAMRLGAYTHLSKPFDTEELRLVIARAMERKQVSDKTGRFESPFLDLIGNSAAMNAIALMIKRIAPTDSTVLISGESGTGKELVAQAIHRQSRREDGPFIPVNCGAFTETLLESELFGHLKGSFTNAVSDRMGLFETADRGTLFLDEVSEMSLPMQVKFLRVLEARSFKPVGGSREIRADVRIIAATNRQLAQRVSEGEFREDLFHRLNVIPIALPPLRERIEDVPLLTGHFLARFSKRMKKEVKTIDEAALSLLVKYGWPGNVRELENTIERAIALSSGESITTDEIVGPMAVPSSTGNLSMAQIAAGGTSALRPAVGRADDSPLGAPTQAPTMGAPSNSSSSLPLGGTEGLPAGGFDLEQHLMEQERAYILQALQRTDWNLTEAAKLLNMTFRSIRYRISKLNIERPEK